MTKKQFVKPQLSISGHKSPAKLTSNEAVSPPMPTPEGMEEEFERGVEQWLIDGDKFLPITRTVQSLPPGSYCVKYDAGYNKHVLVYKPVMTEELLRLPSRELEIVLADMEKFWKRRARYDKYGYIYKRGILLYGKQGNGKTGLIDMLALELIEKQQGIVIRLTQSDDIFNFDEIMTCIREIEPDRRVIAVIEDVDNFLGTGKNGELSGKLQQMLDGSLRYDNIVYIATTNYPELLEERISNRPSRFDLRVEVKPPRKAAREFYLKSKLKKSDIAKMDMVRWLADTVGFTLDHLKEMVLLVFVHDMEYADALARIRGMISDPTLRNEKDAPEKMGFNNKKHEDDD